MTRHTPAAITFCVSLVAATTLMAQAPAADVDAVTNTPPLRVQQASGVQFLNGGVGVAERQAMRTHESEFPLAVTFSGKGGAYGVADQVRVMNGSSTVVTVQNAGPLLMVKVPPGRYTVQADFNGKTQSRDVNVASGGTMVNWSSPAVSE